MKDDEIAHARLSGHDAGLSRREMIAFSTLVRVAIEIRRFAVEDVGATGQFHDFGLVVIIVTNVDDVNDFLTSGDGDTVSFQVA